MKPDFMYDDRDIEWFEIEDINVFWIKKMRCIDCGNLSEFYHNWDSICGICKNKRDRQSLYALCFIGIPALTLILYIIINLIIYVI